MYWALLVIGILAIVVFLVLRVKRGGIAALYAKAVASLCFIATAVAATNENRSFLGFGSFMTIGLVCGLLGDVWLDLKWIYLQDKDSYLYSGFIFFLLGHICFITAVFNASPYTPLVCRDCGSRGARNRCYRYSFGKTAENALRQIQVDCVFVFSHAFHDHDYGNGHRRNHTFPNDVGCHVCRRSALFTVRFGAFGHVFRRGQKYKIQRRSQSLSVLCRTVHYGGHRTFCEIKENYG